MHDLWRQIRAVLAEPVGAKDEFIPLDLSLDDEVALVLWLSERFARRRRGPQRTEIRAAIADARRYLTLPRKALPSIRHPMLPGAAELDSLTRAIRETAAHRFRLPGAAHRAACHATSLVFQLGHDRPRAEAIALAHQFLVTARRLELQNVFAATAPDVVHAVHEVVFRAAWPKSTVQCGVWVVTLTDGHVATLRRTERSLRVEVSDLDGALATLPARLFKEAVVEVFSHLRKRPHPLDLGNVGHRQPPPRQRRPKPKDRHLTF